MTLRSLRHTGFALFISALLLSFQAEGRAIIIWDYIMNDHPDYICDVWDEQPDTPYYGANCENPGDEGEELYCRSGEEPNGQFESDMDAACDDWCTQPGGGHGSNVSCFYGDAEIFYYFDECFIQCWCGFCSQ